MRGIRNRIAHGYFEIDLSTVFDTALTVAGAIAQAVAAQPTSKFLDKLPRKSADPSAHR